MAERVNNSSTRETRQQSTDFDLLRTPVRVPADVELGGDGKRGGSNQLVVKRPRGCSYLEDSRRLFARIDPGGRPAVDCKRGDSPRRCAVKRVLLVFCVVLSSLSIPWAEIAKGDPPDLLRGYRFLPRHSTLEQTGGIAGVNIRSTVYGRFDLVTGWEYQYDPRPISIHPFAKFENVDAWASNPLTATPPLNLNRILNLSGLQGSQLPVAAPFDVYKFEGKTNDGSAVNLYASLIGRWLYLRGGTEPPAGSADFFTYHIHALARQRPFADFNQDDAIDGQDLTMWASNFGPLPAVMGDLLSSGDANSDSTVDGADFLLWQQQSGETPPEMASLDGMLNAALATLPAVSAVPEPATVTLLMLATAGIRLRGRRVA